MIYDLSLSVFSSLFASVPVAAVMADMLCVHLLAGLNF